MFKGSIVALVTPWKNNSLDMEAFVNLIHWHNVAGTSAIVVGGSTGEGALLTQAERETLIQTAVTESTLPIIVGCGAPSTWNVVEQAQQAERLGAKAVLVVTPYYCRTTQEGIYQHFKTIHDATTLPILLYNNPGRTVMEISVETALRLFELERIVGIKDSTADTSRAALMRKGARKPVCLLSGDDPYAAGYFAQGGNGLISITANIVPEKMAEFVNAWYAKNWEKFHHLNSELMPVHYAMVTEPNPMPVKTAMEIIGKCSSEVRLPLVRASKDTLEKLRACLKSF